MTQAMLRLHMEGGSTGLGPRVPQTSNTQHLANNLAVGSLAPFGDDVIQQLKASGMDCHFIYNDAVNPWSATIKLIKAMAEENRYLTKQIQELRDKLNNCNM